MAVDCVPHVVAEIQSLFSLFILKSPSRLWKSLDICSASSSWTKPRQHEFWTRHDKGIQKVLEQSLNFVFSLTWLVFLRPICSLNSAILSPVIWRNRESHIFLIKVLSSPYSCCQADRQTCPSQKVHTVSQAEVLSYGIFQEQFTFFKPFLSTILI